MTKWGQFFYQKFAQGSVWQMRGVQRSRCWILALSGGKDSSVLLHLLHLKSQELGVSLRLVYVRHHLRAKKETRAEELFLKQLAARYQLPLTVQDADVPRALRQSRQSTESAARKLRYAALAEAAHRDRADIVFTAHHADDQVETFFLKLLRGSSVLDLAGMKSAQPLSVVTACAQDRTILLLRPLLDFSRAEIQRYLRENRLLFSEDSSNADPRWQRNWVRKKIIPLLAERQPQLQSKILALMTEIAALKQANATKIRAMQTALRRRNSSAISDVFYLDLEHFMRYHTGLRRAWLHAQFPQKERREILKLEAALARLQGRQMVVGLTRSGIQKISSPNMQSAKFSIPGKIHLPEKNVVIEARVLPALPKNWKQVVAGTKPNTWIAFFDHDSVSSDWCLRSWKNGDRMQVLGMQGSAKLQDIFVNAKVPQSERAGFLVFEEGKKIRWVLGLRQDAESAIKNATRRFLKISVQRLDQKNLCLNF